MDHYPWRITQGASGVSPLSPEHKASVCWRYFLKFEFHFSNIELLSSAHSSQFASNIPLYPQRISGVFAGGNGE
jgi:hypothetical protein